MGTTFDEAAYGPYVGATAKGHAAAPLGVLGRGPMGVRPVASRVHSTGKVISGLVVANVIMAHCVEARGH